MKTLTKKQKWVLIAVLAGVLALSVFVGYGLGSGLFGGRGDENPLSMDYDDSAEKNGRSGIVKITASCSASVREGEDIPADRIRVVRVYADGSEKEITNFTYDPANLSAGESGTVYTPYGAVALDIDYVRVTGLKTKKTYYAGQIPDADGIVAVYADGSEEDVAADQIQMPATALTSGVNRIPVKLRGRDHVLFISAAQATDAQRAASADTTSRTKRITETTLFAGLTEYDACNLVHVVINAPSQIATASAGSGVGILTGGTVSGGLLLSNGQVVAGDATSGHEICITSGGALFSPGAGYSAADIVSQGTVASLLTDAPVLIMNGSTLNEGDVDAVYYNAVGMVRPGEYYLLSSPEGVPCSSMQQIFSAVGCTYARPLTGDPSLLWKGEALMGSSATASAIMFVA